MKLPKIHIQDKSISAVGLAIIGAAIVLVIAGIIYYVQEERQTTAIDEQAIQTNELVKEVKKLSEDNKELNRQNRNFTYCNAMLLAKFTQTQEPIIIKDLNKCIFSSFERDDAVNLQAPANSQIINPQRRASQPAEQSQPSRQTTTPAPKANPTPAKPGTTPIKKTPKSQPSNELLSLGDDISINTPCLNVLALIKTCN